MIIKVTWGTGEGSTVKSAFDRALADAGIANYNIIRLSSVIPPGTEVILEKNKMNEAEHGHRLYAVVSESYQSIPGGKAVAGLGWVTSNNDRGMGIFVEQSGTDQNEVEDIIRKSIENMRSYRPEEHGDIKAKTAEAVCKDKIACALVVAMYKTEGWDD